MLSSFVPAIASHAEIDDLRAEFKSHLEDNPIWVTMFNDSSNKEFINSIKERSIDFLLKIVNTDTSQSFKSFFTLLSCFQESEAHLEIAMASRLLQIVEFMIIISASHPIINPDALKSLKPEAKGFATILLNKTNSKKGRFFSQDDETQLPFKTIFTSIINEIEKLNTQSSQRAKK